MNNQELIRQALWRDADKGAVLKGVLSQATPAKSSESKRRLHRLMIVPMAALLFAITLWSLLFPANEGSLIIAYAAAANGAMQKVTMQPLTAIEIGCYSSLMSSVPGFPFKCQGNGIRAVEFTVDNGQLLLWGDDSRVRELGKHALMENGGTVYWSPLDSGHEIAAGATLRVNISTRDGRQHQETIEIFRDQDGSNETLPIYKAMLK